MSMKNTQKKIKTLKNKCDKLWSEAVRMRDGSCVLCGKKEGLNAHHWIHSRAQGNNTRWDIRNGISLCYPCHVHKAHKYASAEVTDKLKQEAFNRGIVTPEDYESIKNDHTILKFGVEDLEKVKEYLTDYLDSLYPNFYAVGGPDAEE